MLGFVLYWGTTDWPGLAERRLRKLASGSTKAFPDFKVQGSSSKNKLRIFLDIFCTPYIHRLGRFKFFMNQHLV